MFLTFLTLGEPGSSTVLGIIPRELSQPERRFVQVHYTEVFRFTGHIAESRPFKIGDNRR